MKYTSSILFLAIYILLISIQNAYAEPSTSITYLKDGKEVNGEMIYTVDYVNKQISPNSTVIRSEATEDSSVIVTKTKVIADLVLKTPDVNNPSAYSLAASKGIYDIVHVEPIGDQLNKYELSHPMEVSSTLPTLVETSPTTAFVNYTVDFMTMYFDGEF